MLLDVILGRQARLLLQQKTAAQFGEKTSLSLSIMHLQERLALALIAKSGASELVPRVWKALGTVNLARCNLGARRNIRHFAEAGKLVQVGACLSLR